MSGAEERAIKNGSTKKLVLHIEVPGVWADDWPEWAREIGCDPDDAGQMFTVIEEDISSQAVVTLLHLGDEAGPLITAQDGRIVGAQVVDR